MQLGRQSRPCEPKRITTVMVVRGGLAQARVQPHVLAHLGTLLLVFHEQATIATVLPFLLALGGEDGPAPGGASQLAAAAVALAQAGGGLLAEGLDDLVFQRDEELGVAGVALAGA